MSRSPSCPLSDFCAAGPCTIRQSQLHDLCLVSLQVLAWHHYYGCHACTCALPTFHHTYCMIDSQIHRHSPHVTRLTMQDDAGLCSYERKYIRELRHLYYARSRRLDVNTILSS